MAVKSPLAPLLPEAVEEPKETVTPAQAGAHRPLKPLDSLFRGNDGPAAGLYVHVPFCRTKCPYCDFYSIPSTARIPDWIKALEQEAVFYRERFFDFDTIYLGGGTPTVLDGREISALMEILLRHFRCGGSAEITIEANPNDLTQEKLRTYNDLGINRISLGVQSFDDRDLRMLGRRHTAREACASLEMVRETGFENCGIDLIYGLPGQQEQDWRATLEQAIAFNPAHVSCYQLTVSSGTPLGAQKAQGLIDMPDEEAQRSLFLAASNFLRECGYVHYEISNYARLTQSGLSRSEHKVASDRCGAARLCRHNLKYWNRTPYLGLGPSAHSFERNHRWWNHRSVARYCQALRHREPPVAGSECLSEEEVKIERLFLGLRTRSGMAHEELLQYPNAAEVIPDLLRQGYVKLAHERVIPTVHGFLVADRLPLLFC